MPSRSARGSLFAIGGRETKQGEDLAVLGRFVSLCGSSAARIVVLSAASPDPRKRVIEYGAAFRSLGVSDLSFFYTSRRGEAADPAVLAAIDRADGVFLTGGNQLKLVTTLGGTALEARLRSRHLEGLHLGGTSAGASAMSAVMIARGNGRSAARLSSVRLSSGFGILPGVIVDQHFRERDRFGRLLAAVLCNPSMLGFGLDEDTAFVLDPNDQVSVLGSGTLTIVDGSELEQSNVDVVPEDSPAAFAGMRMHVLSAGWTFSLVDKRVGAPPPEARMDGSTTGERAASCAASGPA